MILHKVDCQSFDHPLPFSFALLQIPEFWRTGHLCLECLLGLADCLDSQLTETKETLFFLMERAY